MVTRADLLAAPSQTGHTPNGSLFTALVLEVFRLNGALVTSGNRLCRDTGLTSARWQVLGAVVLEARPLTVAQIARFMGLSRQSVQRVVDELEGAGVVRRVAHPEHRRARLVELTDAGESSYAAVMRRQVPWANRTAVGEGISRATLETTLQVIRELRARLEAEGSHEDG